MKIRALSYAYDRLGHSWIYSPIGDLLSLKLGSHGSGVETVDVSIYLRSASQTPKPAIESLYEEHHDYLNKLPKIVFRRQLKQIEVSVVSQQFTAEDDDSTVRSAQKINAGASEVALALTLATKRIKATDDFATDRFLADVNDILTTGYDTLDEWESIEQRAQEKDLALHALRDPWEQLEIDWGKFHPQARHILDSPFFWEEANDFSPHGNDTGADLNGTCAVFKRHVANAFGRRSEVR